MSCLHTTIHTPSFCGFWYGHPYIPLHFFLKVCFYTLLYTYLSAVIYVPIGWDLSNICMYMYLAGLDDTANESEQDILLKRLEAQRFCKSLQSRHPLTSLLGKL